MNDSTPEPETQPPSLIPDPVAKKELTTASYLIELGNRLISHSVAAVIGRTATREIEIAGRLLIKFGEEWEEKKNAAT